MFVLKIYVNSHVSGPAQACTTTILTYVTLTVNPFDKIQELKLYTGELGVKSCSKTHKNDKKITLQVNCSGKDVDISSIFNNLMYFFAFFSFPLLKSTFGRNQNRVGRRVGVFFAFSPIFR